jgi:hypothetical protein
VITLLDDPFPNIAQIGFYTYQSDIIRITTYDSENRNENIITLAPYTHFEKINLINHLYLENVDKSKLTFKIYNIDPSQIINNNARLSGSYLIIDRCSNKNCENAGGCIITVSSKFTKTQSVTFKWDKYISPRFYDRVVEESELFPYLRSPSNKLEKITMNQKWTVSSRLSSSFYNSMFTINLNSLIVDNIDNNNFSASNAFMAIFSKSNEPINFSLGNDNYPFDDGVNKFYFGTKTDNNPNTKYVDIKCENNMLLITTIGNYFIPIRGEIASGIFTLVLTQDDDTYRYSRSVIKIALKWSIVTLDGGYWENKQISFTCLRVYDGINRPLN